MGAFPSLASGEQVQNWPSDNKVRQKCSDPWLETVDKGELLYFLVTPDKVYFMLRCELSYVDRGEDASTQHHTMRGSIDLTIQAALEYACNAPAFLAVSITWFKPKEKVQMAIAIRLSCSGPRITSRVPCCNRTACWLRIELGLVLSVSGLYCPIIGRNFRSIASSELRYMKFLM